MGQSDLTPLWCPRCQMWVPAEREPHIATPNDTPHYAPVEPPSRGQTET